REARFMTPDEHNPDCPNCQEPPDNFTEQFLHFLQISQQLQITTIEQLKGREVCTVWAVPGGESVQELTDVRRGSGRAGATVVASHALVAGETHQDRSSRPQLRRSTCPELSDFPEPCVS